MKTGRMGICLMTAAFIFSARSAPAVAQPATASPAPMMSVDCAKASDMMMHGGKMDTPPAMTGNVDKDFTAMVAMEHKSMMMMMHVEMQCGKDPNVKAATAKALSDEQMWYETYFHGISY